MAYIWLICLWRISLTISHLGRISLLYPTLGGYPCCIPPGADIPDCISPVADIRECISPVADIPDCISPAADIPDCILEEAYRCQDWYIHPNDHLQQYYQSSCGVSNGVCTVQYCTVCTREFVHLICKNKMRFSTFQKNALKQKLKELKRL